MTEGGASLGKVKDAAGGVSVSKAGDSSSGSDVVWVDVKVGAMIGVTSGDVLNAASTGCGDLGGKGGGFTLSTLPTRRGGRGGGAGLPGALDAGDRSSMPVLN